MGATCIEKLPAFSTECPASDPLNDRLRNKLAMVQATTIFEYCPVCRGHGFKIECLPVVKSEYQFGSITKITALNVEITRPCGHDAKEFRILLNE